MDPILRVLPDVCPVPHTHTLPHVVSLTFTCCSIRTMPFGWIRLPYLIDSPLLPRTPSWLLIYLPHGPGSRLVTPVVLVICPGLPHGWRTLIPGCDYTVTVVDRVPGFLPVVVIPQLI